MHHPDDHRDALLVPTQGTRRQTKLGDLLLTSARALRVSCHLEGIELHRIVDLSLNIYATPRLDPSAHDPRNVLQPRPHVPLDRGRLTVGERTVNPVLDRRNPEYGVEVRIALR